MAVRAAVATPTRQGRDRSTGSEQATHLAVLGGFALTVGGEPVPLPMNGQRVLAFLALKGQPLQRSYVAGSLWLDSTDDRAAGSLRSALWRLNRGHRLVETAGEALKLAPDVRVDIDSAVSQAHRLLDPASSECPGLSEVRLFGDVLPDWYDDWVAFERERFRQLRAHALESLCERLTGAGRFGEAIEAGLSAGRIEPLRESAQRALIRVHLAEGNAGEALQQYRRFCTLLHNELGLAPSAQLEALVGTVTAR